MKTKLLSLVIVGCICKFYNISIAQSDCAKYYFGDFCFTNNTTKQLKVTVFALPNKTLSLAPNETQCIYDLRAQAYDYSITSSYQKPQTYGITEETIKQGQIKIESCKSKTLTLNANGSSTMSEVSTEPVQNAPAITITQIEPVKEEKKENEYRGSGDPLKGLNISKAKEDVNISDKYYALVIGIDKYSGVWNPLKNAVHDASAIKQLLSTKLKIDTIRTLYDIQATRKNIIKEFEWLIENVKENDNVIIYYSGHGEYKKTTDKGYWVPVDAQTTSISDYISNGDIQTFLASIKSKHTLLVSDACFSGDIFRGNTVSIPFESTDKYYGKVYNMPSRQALTSGGNEPVLDSGKDGHSVFAFYLLKYLGDFNGKYMDASTLYNNLKMGVINNSDQTPQLNGIKNTGDEGGQFIFIKK